MMRWNTLKYLFKEGVVGLWKNRTMAIASAGTIILCLLILGVSYSIGNNIEYVLNQLESKFGITAYLKEDLSDARVQQLKAQIEAYEDVLEVTYISKEDALKSFSEGSNDSEMFKTFQNNNPLPASFEIKVSSIEKQATVVAQLETLSDITETTYLQTETGMFIKINQTVDFVCYCVITCLIVVGLLLMSNTIKLTVYIRRREINIMKYIGATDWFIRLPFLIEGILIGTIGALVSTLIVTGSYDYIITNFGGFGEVLKDVSLMPTSKIVTGLIPIFLTLGMGIGLVGSMLSIHKHLKV